MYKNRLNSYVEPQSQTTISVQMLGPPKIRLHDNEIHIPRRQVRALLYYLAAVQTPVSRGFICFLFWPNQSEANSRRNFSHVLSHLRKALVDPEIFEVSNDYISLNPDKIETDLAEFERCFPVESQRTTDLERAVALYSGPFLAGFSLDTSPEYEGWLQQKRHDVELKYLKLLTTTINRFTVIQSYEQAIELCKHYLDIDDLTESIHCQLIELYGKIGDRRAAKRQYSHCVEILARELGVNPLPTTQAIFQAVIHGPDFAKQPHVSPPSWIILPSLDVPFTGRTGQLKTLQQSYDYAREGNPVVLLLSGEIGIGKTRMMQQFASQLDSDTLLLYGSCLPNTHAIPYRPIVDAIRPVLEVRPNLFSAEPTCIAYLSRLFPVLRTQQPDLPQVSQAEPLETIACIFDALCWGFLELVVANPMTVLFLDDLHWVDHVTLGWLTFLIKQLKGRRVLIVGTFCCQMHGDLAEFRYQMTNLDVLQELSLHGIGIEEIKVLTDWIMGHSREAHNLTTQLQWVTGGNPFFILEIMRFCKGNGISLMQFLLRQDFYIPESVRKTVDICIDRLSPVGRQILEAASVTGSGFDFPGILTTAGRSEMETMDGLDELVRRNILTEADGHYCFRHELTRQAIQSGMSSTRQKLLRRRVYSTL